jgi:hypothetical protein
LAAFPQLREAAAEAIRRIFFRTAAASFGVKCDSLFSAESTINSRTFWKSDFTALVTDPFSPTSELSGGAIQNKGARVAVRHLVNPLPE